MTHSFERYTAAGNTFVVMNTWEDPLSLSREEMRMFVRNVCDRHGADPIVDDGSCAAGVGSDGLILINQSGLGAAFRMDFYNPDGSTGMLCGNGSRCAVEAAQEYGFVTGSETEFEVLGAINHAMVLPNGSIRVYFQDPSIIRLNFPLSLEGEKSITASYVDLGSQHVVVFFDELKSLGEADQSCANDLENLNIGHYGPLLRSHNAFEPIGANANFIEVREDGDEKYLRIRTFERGVEGETLACGTGCMSSAIVARLTGRIEKTPIRLLTQSGEYVAVDFNVDGETITNLSLEGPVVRGEEGTVIFDEKTGMIEVNYV